VTLFTIPIFKNSSLNSEGKSKIPFPDITKSSKPQIAALIYYGQNKNFVLKGGRQKKAFCKIKYQISKVGRGLIDKKFF